jgi:hypothetical protein
MLSLGALPSVYPCRTPTNPPCYISCNSASKESQTPQPNPKPPSGRLKHLQIRIKQLGDKATQLLLFLSFALVAAVLLETSNPHLLGRRQTTLLTFAMRCWAGAIFPILVGVLPVKELSDQSEEWYNIVRWSKFVLIWVSIILIILGTIFFVCAIWTVGMAQW